MLVHATSSSDPCQTSQPGRQHQPYLRPSYQPFTAKRETQPATVPLRDTRNSQWQPTSPHTKTSPSPHAPSPHHRSTRREHPLTAPEQSHHPPHEPTRSTTTSRAKRLTRRHWNQIPSASHGTSRRFARASAAHARTWTCLPRRWVGA